MQTVLAVVIPAYKPDYLARTLQAFAAQTDKRFRVYVGDDASPADIAAICAPFQDQLDLQYVRFGSNLGGKSLVQQWSRCVQLSSEPWTWLCCDDDTPDPECIASFYQKLEHTEAKYDLYRFNTLIIDGNDRVIRLNQPHPPHESAARFMYHRLMDDRSSYISEYIVRRAHLDAIGGFVEFPLAWGSDDATWIAAGWERGIVTMDAPPTLRWRLSGDNLSSHNPAHARAKRDALCAFANWMHQRIRGQSFSEPGLSEELLRACTRRWFIAHLLQVGLPIPLSEMLLLAERMRALWGGSSRRHFLRLIRVNTTIARENARHRLAQRFGTSGPALPLA